MATNNQHHIRVRPRPVSFGNPALGTYHGVVFLGDEQQQRLRLVAMLDVPPEQVPEGILNTCRAHWSWIDRVRITISEPQQQHQQHQHHAQQQQQQQQQQPLQQDTITPRRAPSASAMESAASILAQDTTEMTQQHEYSNQESSRQYLILFQLHSDQAANDFVKDLNHQPYTSLEPDKVCSIQHVAALEGNDGVSIMSQSFASDFQSRTKSSPGTLGVEDSQNCPVCLEPMDFNNTNNNNSSSNNNNNNRGAILTTVCNHSFHLPCLLQWQDSPCPVCRYDHSGLNETLSKCHVCGTTHHNYVCLICGVISCGAPTGPLGHARQHYDETLHAYALDTETQHVWDFCGQGYVHRLLHNDRDGKLVEVSDPNAVSQERSQRPGLSNAQEQNVLHCKLEGFATQYYTLLKSQLEQQRIYYEGRLEEIRRDYDHKKDASDLISALKQERNQLAQRHETLQRRFAKVSEDVTFLKNMNESLEANKGPMKRQVQQAQREQNEQRDMFQTALPLLEKKVTVLMLQLEESLSHGRKPAAT